VKTSVLIDKYYRDNKEAKKILLAHSIQVAKLAVSVATYVKRTEAVDIEFVEQAALLHDIGMLYTDTPKLAWQLCYTILACSIPTLRSWLASATSPISVMGLLALSYYVKKGSRVMHWCVNATSESA